MLGAAYTLVGLVGAILAGDVTPLYQGLPPQLPQQLPELKKFVRFDPIPDHRAPLLNGRPKLEGTAGNVFHLSDVFEEEHFALLPAGTHIRVAYDASGKESWDYPTDTRVIHRIFLRTAPRTIFEMRLLWKRNDGQWSYGIYAPQPGSESALLDLNRDPHVAVAFEAVVTGGEVRGPVRVSGTRLHPQSCQGCHYVHSASAHQYPMQQLAGPCGFVPANPSVIEKWAPAYKRIHGYWPF